MAELAIKSGLRISDLLKLKKADVAKTMTIYETKSKRTRTFKIGKKLYEKLKSLSVGLSESDFVFYSARESPGTKHIHRSTVHRRIKKALQGQGFDASVHSMRKLFAQNVFKKTGSVKKVQRVMNHHRITTTAAYLDIDVEQLIKKGARK